MGANDRIVSAGLMLGKKVPDVLPELPPKVYSGPEVPVSYDENWQRYRNLTEDQKTWFRSQPEWNSFLDYVSANPVTAMAATPVATVSAILAAKLVAG